MEDRIAHILANAADVSLFSPELTAQCTDWNIRRYLAPDAANILRPFEHDLRGARVLEIGASFGQLTRYLGEIGARTTALEPSEKRRSIIRARCRDLPQVEVRAENLSDYAPPDRFDVIVMVGALGQADRRGGSDDPELEMLKRARSLLHPQGRLILAAENRFGLKYFAGHPDSGSGLAYGGLEGRHEEGQSRPISRRGLETKLKQAGFSIDSLLLPFPDHQFVHAIVDSEAFEANDFDASVFAWSNASRDPQRIPDPPFSQELAWAEICDGGLAADLANAFLLVATPFPTRHAAARPLAWHFSMHRRPAFRKTTTFRKSDRGDIRVMVEMLEGTEQPVDTGAFLFHPELDSAYFNAPTFDREFLRLAAEPRLDLDGLVQYFSRYRSVLMELIAQDAGHGTHLATGDVPGTLLDAIPRNILILKDGSPLYFDREWTSRDALSMEHMIVRSLFALVEAVTALGNPTIPSIRSVRDLADHILRELGMPVTRGRMNSILALEARFLTSLAGRSHHASLIKSLDRPLPVRARNHGSFQTSLKELDRIIRRPWRPLVRSAQARALYGLVAMAPLLPLRVRKRLVRSARKRDLRTLWQEDAR
jgi:SAM-dependent methyltransferase